MGRQFGNDLGLSNRDLGKPGHATRLRLKTKQKFCEETRNEPSYSLANRYKQALNLFPNYALLH